MSLGQLWSFLGVALPALAALLVPLPAVDLAYQLRAGAGILDFRGIPDVDTWTFTVQGVPWLDQQWGAQALLAGVFELGGWTGLALLRAALVAATFLLLGTTLRSMGCARRPAAVLSLLGFIVASPGLALRPQLFAIVLFAATMAILAGRRVHPRRLWLIPPIAVAWANLHGSFPLVVVLVALGWLDELTRARAAEAMPAPSRPVTNMPPPVIRRTTGADRTAPLREPSRPESSCVLGSTGLALLGAISAAVTLATPFGIDTWRYVANLAANPAVAGQVSEWRPPWPLDPGGALFYASLLVVVVVAGLRLRADAFRVRAATIAPFATLLAFGALGLATGRGLAWWALVAPVGAATLAHDGALAARLPRLLEPARILFRDSPPGRSTRTTRLNGVIAALLVVAAVALLPAWRPAGPAGVPVGTLSHAPQGVAAELRALRAGGALEVGDPVWNPQAWGSWLEWSVPGFYYAVDSRIEIFPAVLWTDVEVIASGAAGTLSTLDEYGVAAVVQTADQGALEAALGASASWRLAYRDVDGAIWVRRQGR